MAQEVGGVKKYIHADHLGSATVITNQVGVTVENTTYSPYGAVVSGGTESRYQYEGKEFDSVLEHYDFNFRPYNPTIQIFVKPDDLIPNVYDPP